MIKAGRLGHVVLNVSDLKAAIAFYTRVVGLEVVTEDEITPETGTITLDAQKGFLLGKLVVGQPP